MPVSHSRPSLAADKAREAKETTLKRTLTLSLNELGVDVALIAVFEREGGPLVSYGYRGFSPREAHAILRTLAQPHPAGNRFPIAGDGEAGSAERLRMITPTAKALLAVPLRHQNVTYGYLVIGRKETATFSKKEKALVETASEEISAALEKAALFDGSVLLRRPFVAEEPIKAAPSPVVEPLVAPASHVTPERKERISALLVEIAGSLTYDRAWVTYYDPIAGSIEVLAITGTDESRDPKRDLKPGQRLALDASASGWAVRHRKPRVDHDLASTQGRFLDHKQLFKDKYRSTLVIPFFLRGQVGGTITLASKTPDHYNVADAKSLEPLIVKLVELLQEPTSAATPVVAAGEGAEMAALPAPPAPSEPLIRKQERQAALNEFSAFLATEVREPLASIRAQLEDVTGEGILEFDPQTRIETAMRDLIRVEAILHEILDFAKPLELNRRPCRIPDVIEGALTLVAVDLEVNRIQLTRHYAPNLPQVRCDEAKVQQAFLSIYKNSIEAMTPGGHLEIEVIPHRHGRGQLQVQITIRNDGAPIPTEHVGKVFEPFFTTKRSGTGLGLASVKKIVEEHQGQISIASGPGQGTAVIIRLPALAYRGGRFRRGGRRRPHRGR